MKLGSLEKGYQLCFSCKNACGGCSWSRCGEPVDGWVATPTIILQNAEEKNSYSISECPQYEYDGFCKKCEKSKEYRENDDFCSDICPHFYRTMENLCANWRPETLNKWENEDKEDYPTILYLTRTTLRDIIDSGFGDDFNDEFEEE